MTSNSIANSNTVPYGSWKSPITSDEIVAGSIRLGELRLDDTDIYWSEGRPTEAGRNAVVRWTENGAVDILPEPYNARSRVHEYGGGAFIVTDGVLYFSNFADGRLYRTQAGLPAEPMTPEAPLRYADAVLDKARNRLICIVEDFSQPDREPINEIASVNLNSGEIAPLVSGNDFYSSPRINLDGSRLAWLTWNHPNMPWDGTELWVADILADGTITNASKVAGGLQESIGQPEWSPDGILTFVSDRTGWWNLYRWIDGKVRAIVQLEAEFGVPHWVFRMSTYGYESADSIVCTYTQKGKQHLARLHPETGTLTPIEIPFTRVGGLQVGATQAIFAAGSPTSAGAIVRLNLETHEIKILRRVSSLEIDEAYMSIPEAIEFPTSNGRTAYGFYYPPKNGDVCAPPDEKPPLLVKSHGGPTAATAATLDWRIQYWTSRGVAVLDVNYGGSTGYGRAYREVLKGNWGIVDVDDCCNGAQYLVDRGLVDGERLAIDGGSAGGYTTLAALTFRDTFKAGASLYGVSDLEVLARDTHKFESRYLDSLVGPYPEAKAIYEERAPINHLDRLACPVIFLQGEEDKIVPPNQAELMVNALKQKGLPVAYVLFEGEQHGFRKAENIKRALDAELYFYARVFGFELADEIEPVEIFNLPTV